MKNKITILFIAMSSFVIGQNVAINGTGAAPNTSAMLDIAANNKGVSFPNVALTSETDAATIPTPMTGLMVYNTTATMPCGAGLYFNNGTAAAPIWTCFNKTIKNLHAYDNLGRTGVTSNALTLQPNCNIAFTIPTGQIADIKVDAFVGGTNAATTANGTSIIDVVVYLDGTFLPVGGWNRVSCNNSGGGGNAFFTSTISTWITGVTAGPHTIQLRTARFNGTLAVNIGGDCSLTTNCGELHAVINYR